MSERHVCLLHNVWPESGDLFCTVSLCGLSLSLFLFSQLCDCLFVLETIRTGAMRVILKTAETQRLRVKLVLYCPICAFNWKIKRANFCRKQNCQMFNAQSPGPLVQQSWLRHSSAHAHHKRLSQKNRIHPVTTVTKQPHQVRNPFWPHRKTTFYHGDQVPFIALQVQNHHCPSTN